MLGRQTCKKHKIFSSVALEALRLPNLLPLGTHKLYFIPRFPFKILSFTRLQKAHQCLNIVGAQNYCKGNVYFTGALELGKM